jgi:hypothetical protein
VDADASIQTTGADSIISGGAKVYAPRLISGRIAADAVCLLEDGSAMLVVHQQRLRQSTGEEIVKQTLTICSTERIVGIEFPDTAPLLALGMAAPATRAAGSNSGVLTRPKGS